MWHLRIGFAILQITMAVDIDRARRNYQERIDEQSAARRKRWERARDEADHIVRHIAEHFAPKRIIQWGSVLRPERFTEISDIDVAVEGISDPDVWSRMERDVERMATIPLDLVRFEHIHPEHQKQILRRGKVVYERTKRT